MLEHPFLLLSDESLRAKLATLFSMPGLGIAISTTDKQFYDVNGRFCEITGYTLQQLKGMTWAEITHEDDLEQDVVKFEQLQNEETTSYTVDKRFVRKDGHYVWVELTVQTIIKPTGEIDFFIGFVKEITHRVKQLHNLREQNRQLEEFAQITSHNLRSPVGNLRGLIDLYKRESDPIERAALFDHIDTVTTTLLETINILARTLQIRDNPDIMRDHVIIAEVVDRVRSTMLSDVASTQAIIETDFDRCSTMEYPEIYLDSILQNLLTNTIRYRSPDRSLHVAITTWMDGDSPMMSFRDNGLGMDMEKVGTRIFGLHKTFHRHPDARGIGLFLTKNMVDVMHGTIKCDSKENVGTTFTIRFSENDA